MDYLALHMQSQTLMYRCDPWFLGSNRNMMWVAVGVFTLSSRSKTFRTRRDTVM